MIIIGDNVGTYSTYYLHFYYKQIEEFEKAELMKAEIEEKYSEYINHNQLLLGEVISTD